MNQPIPFAVIFDMDGTLFQTEQVAVRAFRRTFEHMKEEGLIKGKSPSDQEIKSVFGMTMEQIWQTLFPDESAEIRSKADRLMLEYEIDELGKGNGSLYPGVVDTLTRFEREGIPLFIASNGLDEYIRSVARHMDIESYFKDFYSAGRFQTRSKDQLVARLIRDYHIENGVMVGDRSSDIEAGRANHLFTVGCRFGFSSPDEIKEADLLIERFADMIPPVLEYQKRIKNSQLH
ncbi:MAG: HAD-IA family hydrolase [Bacillaceae bacterium]|nr:HAD-IA family hydrolase [Bacillaceae bacterium]